MKFVSSIHTKKHLLELITKCGDKYKAADAMGISYMTFTRWLKKVDDQEVIITKPQKTRTIKKTKIPTINQLFEFMKGQPDHVHYSWFMRHMNQPRKHYHAAIQKTLDVVNEYQEK